MATLERVGKLLVTIKEEYVIYENSDTKRVHLRKPEDGPNQTFRESYVCEGSLEEAIDILKKCVVDFLPDDSKTVTVEEVFD